MPCPTCDHTMQRVNDGLPKTFWCPRCGTLVSDSADHREMSAPKLVRRAFALAEAAPDDCDVLDQPIRAVLECMVNIEDVERSLARGRLAEAEDKLDHKEARR